MSILVVEQQQIHYVLQVFSRIDCEIICSYLHAAIVRVALTVKAVGTKELHALVYLVVQWFI
jgi:hypothetical protein